MNALDMAAALDLPLEAMEPWADLILSEWARQGIVERRHQADWLAQVSVSSGGFFRIDESGLEWFPDELLARFKRSRLYPYGFASIEDASEASGDPVGLLSRMYAGIGGNGSPETEHGWLFRRSGLLGVLGRCNHEKAARHFNMPLLVFADWCRTREGAVAHACWWWQAEQCGALSDLNKFRTQTLRLTFGALGDLGDRVALIQRARIRLGVDG